jgi:pseudouridine synthase
MDKEVTAAHLKQLRNGVTISTPVQHSPHTFNTSPTLPCTVDYAEKTGDAVADKRWIYITLVEGRNRQIRRMAEAVGLKVVHLCRTSFAGIRLGGLSEGQWEVLTAEEMKKLRAAMMRRDEMEKINNTGNSSNNGRRKEEDLDDE